MVHIEPFVVEEWMDLHQPNAKHDIAETCCASVSMEELQNLCENKSKQVLEMPGKLDYGDIRGSDKLRTNLATLYSSKAGSPVSKDSIIITPGAIAANYLFLVSHVGPGDHVICHYPTYQQLYSVPASLGAEVDLWKSDPDNEWVPDIEQLKLLVKPNTKLIILNNPNNPTGSVLKRSLLDQIIEVASAGDITILSDEVYRPVFHGITPVDSEFPSSMLSLYRKTAVTGSLSKAYSLAGIRVGWIASRDEAIIEKCAAMRHYTTISVSKLDDQVAAFALDRDTVHSLLGRNIQLAKKNLEILDRFILKHDDECSWVKPVAGTTAFVKFCRDGQPVDSAELSKRLMEKSGVLVLPGDVCFGPEFAGYVRIGYVQRTEALQAGLDAMRMFMKREFDDVPLATRAEDQDIKDT
ncbi:PLP-dependent transferase [Pseudovirgaria hyperparasitica]|uniref:PLP-dependent transferase n=1 Tax=Pseudovirgaria hyperparasitica TaxID=470096 RepID=A0A6A6VZE6_9PEZI|nr:PLP-dependent transferase [Pseudovirgaria hyperparasitica]KAF2755070.1 PLP-dependent transferase [Pseudovirgaria hyperparasitica]